MKTEQLPYRAGLPARSLAFFAALVCLAWGGLVTGCTDEAPVQLPDTPAASRPLQPGETCTVSLSVSNLPDLKEATTKAIPEGKQTELLDFTNSELTGRDRKRAGWASTEVRTEYGAEEEAATKAMTADRYFQNGSRFRLLVFKGPYNGTVNMNAPIDNRVCRIDGNAAVFEEPEAPLGLLKGNYTFICFPADERFNTWAVGQTLADGATVNIQKDDDFVYFKLADVELNTTTYTLSLNSFVRQCYKLTVKLSINEDLGYLLKPNDKVPLQLSGANINTGVFNLKSGAFTSRTESTIENMMQVNGTGVGSQTFTAVENMLVPAESGSSKLSIAYPDLTVLKPAGTSGSIMDSVFTIKAGTLVTAKDFLFQAGNSYTVTLNIGEYVKGILITFQNSAGDQKKVLFASGNLYYDKSVGKWGVGSEQCDYGYVENGVAPNVADNKLITGNISYYFMYGCLDATIINGTGNDTATEAGGMLGFYTGKGDLRSARRDPCQKMGGKWRSPTWDIFMYMSREGTPIAYNSSSLKKSSDYFALDENGNRLVNSTGNPYIGTYTPTDDRNDRTPVKGMWIGLSAEKSNQTTNTDYNYRALFLPAAGELDRGVLWNFSKLAMYWGEGGDKGNAWGAQENYIKWVYASTPSYYFWDGSYRYNSNQVRCCLPE